MPETTCIVPHCNNPGAHILPKEKDRQVKWIHAIRRGITVRDMWKPPSRFSYVCRSHFRDDDYNTITSHGTVPERKCLKRTAVPSVFSWSIEQSQATQDRQIRYTERSKRRRVDNIAVVQSPDIDIILEESFCDEVAANETITCDEVCHASVSDTCNLKNEKEEDITFRSAKTQTSSIPMFSIENFKNDEAGIHFYTGLETYVKFLFVLTTLGPAVHCLNYAYNQVLNISIPEQFFLVLMKLRRNTTNFELSRFFGVSESTVKNIFLTWICFMSKQWHEINIWPPQELVHYFSPSGFRAHYPTTRVIMDGTEFPIKKPNNPTSQQATFSTYKNKNTVKVLVGATPGGLVSFLSGSYGGTTSDRQIVERSGLVQLCDPHDSIMADKGFNVQDLFAPRDVTVNIPTFFKKKNRMNCGTVMKDRKIASKRVHIERLIGLGKTFKILQTPMTATETKLSSEIIYVCFMLCNFRSCIIPRNA